MKWFYDLLLISLAFVALCISCKGGDIDPEPPFIIEIPDDFDTNPSEVDTAGTVIILFDAQTATITNPFEEKGVTITRHEAHVVIHSTTTDTITYILSGSTTNGSLKIYSDTRLNLTMNGVSIINTNDPALNIQSTKRVSITLVEGASNRLAGGTQFVSVDNGEKAKAAFYSRGQLVFSGKGSLTAISRYNHAICTDHYLRIDDGTITIPQSANDGIHAKEYIEIRGGTIDVTSINDGMQANDYVQINGGSIKIETLGSKAHGIKSATEMNIQSLGDIDIHVKGEASKALKCGGNMIVTQGVINLITSGNACYDASEEDNISSSSGIKCDENLTVSGGIININSLGSGGKGINVGGTLTINDGEIAVSTTGNEFKHKNDNTKAKAIKNDLNMNFNGGSVYAFSTTDHAIDTKGALAISGGKVVSAGIAKKGFSVASSFKISGGTIVGFGGSSSAPAGSDCTQYVVNYAGGSARNAFFHVASTAGQNMITYQLPHTSSKAFVLFSSPELENNSSYTISSGGAITGGQSFHGLYSGTNYSGGTIRSTFTISQMVTNL